MLTGDKMETAKCIAISTGFKTSSQSFEEFDSENDDFLYDKIEKFIPKN